MSEFTTSDRNSAVEQPTTETNTTTQIDETITNTSPSASNIEEVPATAEVTPTAIPTNNETTEVHPTDVLTEGHDEHGSVDGEDAGAAQTTDNAVEINGVPPNDVKNIILQVLSPYFDDEGGEDDAQRYDHIKAQAWIQLICDGIMEKLLAMRRPYKYVTHCVIMRKSGAGIHICSSCYYSQADGWVNHAHDLSAHIYAVVTVYWSVI